ncbi:MAG: alpha/beta hydrolase [Flammeovirgaceae bacterium]|nr:alpha/beta hydrolase [Flammeovirgaceae bacterium]HCX23304.1 alpha/beta hydrolase [Cytophagales bacterium]
MMTPKFCIVFICIGLSISLFGQGKNYFQSFDQTQIAFEDSGKGMPIILIHGFISSGSSWNNGILKRELIDAGYRVIIPDLRGNGDSDKPSDPLKYANDAETKDLIALANHLKLDSYMAIGYSRGSIVLAQLLTQDQRITKAVMGGMGIDFTNPEWDRRIMFAEAFAGTAPLNETTKGAVNYARSINANLKILSYLQTYQPVTSIEELQKIKTPILIIAGDEDTDNGDPGLLAEVFLNSQLVIITGGHNNAHKTPEFAKEITQFIQKN